MAHGRRGSHANRKRCSTFRTRRRSRRGPRAARPGLACRSVPDSPDLHVTAVRRLPAVEAEYLPFPDSARCPRLRQALESRGIMPGLHPPGGGDRPCARRPQRRRHHADRIGQDALLQRAGAERDPAGPGEPRAVPVSDQGAGAGSTRRAAGAVRNRRGAGAASRSACSPTTATRRRMPGGRSARARTWCSAIPTCCTPASCRTIHAGRSCSRTCATSSSTSCTPIAACSAATCATCCGGCGGSAVTTARTRCSSARRRRSPIRRELAERLVEQPFEVVSTERRAARREVLRLRQPAGGEPPARHPAILSERDAPDRRRSS